MDRKWQQYGQRWGKNGQKIDRNKTEIGVRLD